MMVAGLQPGYMRCTVYGRACFQLGRSIVPTVILPASSATADLPLCYSDLAMVCPSKGYLSICR